MLSLGVRYYALLHDSSSLGTFRVETVDLLLFEFFFAVDSASPSHVC